LAAEQHIPSYVIFSNASLEDMCIRLPETSEEFLQVSGVGEKKLEHYGSYFMEEISDYLREKSHRNPPSRSSGTTKRNARHSPLTETALSCLPPYLYEASPLYTAAACTRRKLTNPFIVLSEALNRTSRAENR